MGTLFSEFDVTYFWEVTFLNKPQSVEYFPDKRDCENVLWCEEHILVLNQKKEKNSSQYAEGGGLVHSCLYDIS